MNDKTKLVKEAKNDKASRRCWSAYCSKPWPVCCAVHRGIGLCIYAQGKWQTMQQAAVTILQCDPGISHHHTAAAAAALTRSIEPVLLLLLLLWLC